MGKKAQKRRQRMIRLHVIPEPAADSGRTVMRREGPETVYFRSTTNPDTVMVCGQCGTPLVEGMPVSNVQSIVFQCNRCKAYNETLA